MQYQNNDVHVCEMCSTSAENLLDNIDIINHFQPIISNINNSIGGFESLCRGVCKSCERLIPPFELFKLLKNENDLLEVDTRARTNAIKIFDKLLTKKPNYLLFLNFDAKLIEQKIENINALVELCKNTNVSSQNIVIEITELNPCRLEILTEFVDECRQQGFLIALDDVGTGHSNFDRISTIKPDIIKLDRSIVSGLDKNYQKKVIFRSMSRLATQLGALLLAEGVEEEGEVIYSLELGADLQQGFYFAKPAEINDENMLDVQTKINHIGNIFKEYKTARINDLKKKYSRYDFLVTRISKLLSLAQKDEFDSILNSYVNEFETLESLYVIDANGMQFTDTHMSNLSCKTKPTIFKVFKKGDYHGFKDYFYLLHNEVYEKFTTNGYLSFITGNLCKTISMRFFNTNNEEFILCMNIIEEEQAL